jgi:hypothetical protein
MIEKLIQFFVGGSGIASGVANVGKVVALAPIALYFFDHKDQIAVSLTYGQLALAGGFVFALIQVAHAARSGNQG